MKEDHRTGLVGYFNSPIPLLPWCYRIARAFCLLHNQPYVGNACDQDDLYIASVLSLHNY